MVEVKGNPDRAPSGIFEMEFGSLLTALIRPLIKECIDECFKHFVEVELKGILTSLVSAADLKTQTWRLLRIDDVLDVIPVKSTKWWEGVGDGYFPKGVKIGSRTVAWRYGDIRDLAERLYREGQEEKAS